MQGRECGHRERHRVWRPRRSASPQRASGQPGGHKKGGLRRPDDARLRYGEALLQAGQKQKATTVLREVKGTDGTADIARLWVLSTRA